jgi:hypothetical protein
MRMPVIMGWCRDGLQYPRGAWPSLPVVQPPLYRRRDRHGRDVRAAVGYCAVHALELEGAHAGGNRNVPGRGLGDCPYIWAYRLVLATLVLARLPYFRHTGRTYFMALEPSDILFIAIVIWLILEIINSDGGGGHRARVPVR